MKTRILTILGISVIIVASILSYLQWGTGNPSQLHCMFNKCDADLGGRTVYPIPDQNMTRAPAGNASDSVWCQGDRLCLAERVTRIVDGDTIYLGDYEIRLSLTNTPERHETGFYDASKFTAEMCPVGSIVLVDQDDLQPYDVYNRILGKVVCQNKVLNSELLYAGHANILVQYCDDSEFSAESWAQEFGC